MQDDIFDDGGSTRTPTFRDYDAERGPMIEAFKSIPAEVHEEHKEKAMATFFPEAAKTAAAVLGNGERNITVADAPEDVKRIEEAAARDAEAAARAEAAKASGVAPGAIPGAAPGVAADFGNAGAPGSAGDGTPGTIGDSTSQRAAKPNSLETTLASIKNNGDRQKSLIITGDPAIEKAFLAKLASQKQLYYSGGSPVITISRAKAMKMLQEIAREHEGATATHALQLKMDREGGGVLGDIKAGIKNNLPFGLARSHQVDVVVVGKDAAVEAKMKELGGFVSALEGKGHIEKNMATVRDGQLIPPDNGPAELKATATMYDTLAEVQRKVNTYNAEQSAIQQELKENRTANDYKDLKKESKDADGAAPKDGPLPVNANTEKLAKNLDKAFQAPELLTTKNANNTMEAVLLLRDARKRKDPHEPEMATLPDGMREKAIVQLAALVEKADAKAFGASFKEQLDEPQKGGGPSHREKVATFIEMEAKRDTSFGDKAAPILKDLVDRSVLTEKQAEAITGRIASAVAIAKAAGAPSSAQADASQAPVADASKAPDSAKEAAPAATPTDASKAAEPAQTATSAVAAADVAASKDAAAPQTPVSESKDATVPAAERKEPALDSTSALAANSAAPAGMNRDGRVEPTLGNPGDVAAAPAAPEKASGDAAAPVVEKPQSARDRIEALVKEGPANLTAEKAHALVAELDGIRSKPLAALDSGSGSNPTRTLVRTEALLKELESGRFGAELKAQAKDLAEPLAKWEKQDISRFNNDASVKTVSRDDVVAGVKTGMPGWNGNEPAAQKDATAAVPAPSKDQASTAPSIPVTPEKAPTSASEAAAPAVAPAAAPAAKVEATAPAPQEPAQAKVEAPAVAKADAPAVTASEVVVAPKVEAPAAKVEAAAEVKAAPAPDAAAVAAKEQAAIRLTETESAGGKLSQLMANPAGSFTNRDKSWNEENIQRAAKEVLRLDPDSMSQLSAQQRAKVVVYATWVAENARDGKLPGFTSEEGKATAQQLVDRAASLIGKLEAGAKTTPDVEKSVEKADRLVSSMAQLQKTAAASNQASREEAPRGSIGPAAANALAKDLVQAVYQSREPREAETKYLLKNASNLTPATTKEMEPQARAQTAVAMSHLAQKVRNGALGEFSQLPSSVQKQTLATANAAEAMLTSMGKDPSMRAELNQAYSELHAKTGKAANAAAPKMDGLDKVPSGPASTKDGASAVTKVESPSADKGAAPAVPAPSKTEGRSLDR